MTRTLGLCLLAACTVACSARGAAVTQQNVVGRTSAKILGMLAVGDSTIGTLTPGRHVRLWRGGPRSWDDTLRWFEERPRLTRVVAAAEAAAGLWLMLRATRQ